MREIDLNIITENVREMILEAACELEAGILEKLKEAVKSEESPLGKSVLRNIESNAELASKKRIPMC